MKTLSILTLLLFSQTVFSACGKYGQPKECGIKVYQQRCALCHGNLGLGEGTVPLIIASYADTNLLKKNPLATTKEEIYNIIASGYKAGAQSLAMPPWRDELTAAELDSVTDIIYLLKTDTDAMLETLQTKKAIMPPSKRNGRVLFSVRCALCHGKHANGKGRMARVIKNPPPYNLTKSTVGLSYVKNIITNGGKAMKRSEKMPPWGKDLNESEIDSLVIYLLSIRSHKNEK